MIFTGADSLKDKSTEQHIQSQEALQLIIQRCGGRYHAFDSRNKSDAVKELLVKIDDVVANNGKHFETHDGLLDIQRKRNKNKENAESRQKTVQDKRGLLKKLSKYRLADMYTNITSQTFGLKASA